MRKLLSESKIRHASLRSQLMAVWEERRKSSYTISGVVDEFLSDESVKDALDSERMLWLRTAATMILRKIIKKKNKEEEEQYFLPGVTVTLEADYVIPGFDDDGEDEEGGQPDYHVPRVLLTVAEHARHVDMRRRQHGEDGLALQREARTELLMQAAKARHDERVVDVLARLRPH